MPLTVSIFVGIVLKRKHIGCNHLNTLILGTYYRHKNSKMRHVHFLWLAPKWEVTDQNVSWNQPLHQTTEKMKGSSIVLKVCINLNSNEMLLKFWESRYIYMGKYTKTLDTGEWRKLSFGWFVFLIVSILSKLSKLFLIITNEELSKSSGKQ